MQLRGRFAQLLGILLKSNSEEESKEPAAAKGKKAKVKAKKKRSLEDVAPAKEAAKEAPRPKKVRKVKNAAKA
eukprot:s1708_g9.t1